MNSELPELHDNVIELIFTELESEYPLLSIVGRYHYYNSSEYTSPIVRGDEFWNRNFIMLLLILADNNIPYEVDYVSS